MTPSAYAPYAGGDRGKISGLKALLREQQVASSPDKAAGCTRNFEEARVRFPGLQDVKAMTDGEL